MHGGNRRWVPLPIGVKILCALYLHYKVEFTFKKIKGLNWVQHWVSRIGLCSLASTGSKEVLPGNRKMHLLRRDVRLNDVNWSLVATSLLGNSGYQNDRKIYDQSKMTLRLAISWEPRVKQIPTDLLTSLPFASRWIIPGSIHCHSLSSTTLISVFST